jgi:hypothetical protein
MNAYVHSTIESTLGRLSQRASAGVRLGMRETRAMRVISLLMDEVRISDDSILDTCIPCTTWILWQELR